QEVLIAADPVPGFKDLVVVVFPVLTKPVHRLAGSARKMQIANGENPHRGYSTPSHRQSVWRINLADHYGKIWFRTVSGLDRRVAMKFEDVLVPVDFSPNSVRAIEFAMSLVEPDGEVYLLHVIDSDFVSRLSGEGFAETEAATSRMRQKAEARLQEMIH